MNLHEYDLIIVNSSGGKDSVCALYDICTKAILQTYPIKKIVVSHQDLKSMEWVGVRKLVEMQSDYFGIEKTVVSTRRNKNGVEEDLLDYVLRRGKWPSNKQRFCTSDFKRGPGARVVTEVTKELGECKVLHVYGFRKDESPSRAKKEPFVFNERLSTKKRKVWDYLPIHEWSTDKVWSTIRENSLPYHRAYDLGMPRLSCVFCIFSPFDALVVAGRENPELLDRYIEVEKKIRHTFRDKFSIAEVKTAIDNGYQPKNISNWVM